MKKSFTIILLALIQFNLFGQVSKIGQPLAFSNKIILPEEYKTLPKLDNVTLLNKYQAKIKASNEKLVQYGEAIDVNWDFFKEASKTVLNKDKNVYHLLISSKNAISLNIIFNDFNLAKGTLLYIFDKKKKKYIGAYTSLNNNISNELGTELIYSDKLYIEVVEPKENEGKSTLNIGRVIHGFTNLDLLIEKALNDSGNCNIDVNCPQGNGWEIPRNAVAMLVNAQGGFCSGAMVNNTEQDGKPYFLTANHCGSSPGSWVFRFRWESPAGQADCGTIAPSINGPETMNINGGTTRANYAPSDFHLIELSNIPDPNWEVTYCGWDKSGNIPQSGAGIHHPNGDIKKIAISTNPFISEAYSGTVTNHWKAKWSEGVTEGGSSGSPLFNQYRRIVGQLHGGASGCGSTDMSDLYGKFSESWIGGGTPQTRLSDWLDPSNTDVDFIDANVSISLDPFFTSQIIGAEKTLCTENISPKIVLTNAGSVAMTTADISYIVDGNETIVNWNGNLGLYESDTIKFGNIVLGDGQHTIQITVNNPNSGVDQNLNNNVATKTFMVILNGVNLNLELNLDCYANETSWTVFDDNNNPMFSGGNYAAANQIYTVNEQLCLKTGCYDLFVYDSWGDGMTSTDCDSGSFILRTEFLDSITGMKVSEADFGNAIVKNFCVNINSIVELQNEIFIVSPNPFTNSLNISNAKNIKAIQLYDMTGKLVFKYSNHTPNSNTLTIYPFIDSGIYNLLILTDNEVIMKKITK